MTPKRCETGPGRSSPGRKAAPSRRSEAAWPALPEAIRVGILAMVKAASGKGTGDEAGPAVAVHR
jgi:hypothetical protein